MDELHAGLASLKTAFDLTKTILDIQGTVKVQGKVFELQREILAAQQSALAANEAQMALVREKRRLEEQIAQLEAWNSENERYALSEVGRGVFAYALKPEAQVSEPHHLLCAKCFQHRKKSFLQRTAQLERGYRVHRCHECKAEYAFNSKEPETPAPETAKPQEAAVPTASEKPSKWTAVAPATTAWGTIKPDGGS